LKGQPLVLTGGSTSSFPILPCSLLSFLLIRAPNTTLLSFPIDHRRALFWSRYCSFFSDKLQSSPPTFSFALCFLKALESYGFPRPDTFEALLMCPGSPFILQAPSFTPLNLTLYSSSSPCGLSVNGFTLEDRSSRSPLFPRG